MEFLIPRKYLDRRRPGRHRWTSRSTVALRIALTVAAGTTLSKAAPQACAGEVRLHARVSELALAGYLIAVGFRASVFYLPEITGVGAALRHRQLGSSWREPPLGRLLNDTLSSSRPASRSARW